NSGTATQTVAVCSPGQFGPTERVNVSSAGVEANNGSANYQVAISANGRYVAFASFATNLVPIQNEGISHIYVRDRVTGTTERVSVSSSGAEGDSSSVKPSISADGRFVAFESFADNLVEGDTNQTGVI